MTFDMWRVLVGLVVVIFKSGSVPKGRTSSAPKGGTKSVIFASIILCIFALVAIVTSNPAEIHGQKLEEGVHVARGTITNMMTVHGGDWHMKLDTSSYVFEFPYGTFTTNNTPHVGDSIVVAYEWQLLWYNECVDSEGDGYDSWQYWAPLVLDWEVP